MSKTPYLNDLEIVEIEGTKIKHKHIYQELKCFLHRNILLIGQDEQLSILGQAFRPIYCGKVTRVTDSVVTLFPVQIRMPQAPEFKFPTPLNFPIDKIGMFTPFDCSVRFSLT